jgi:uncharacterized tellurite resistance protein B-like protein
MDLKNLSPEQRNALLDTLVIGMYSDAHLARTEDARIERILSAMGFTAKFEREREFDAAVTRVRRHLDAATAVRDVSGKVAQCFSRGGERNEVIKALTELIGSDSRVSVEETNFLETVKAAFMADRLDRIEPRE